MLEVCAYSSLNEEQRLIFHAFCEEVSVSDEPASKNMRNMQALIDERFTHKGEMFALLEGERILGCSGCYVSNFSPYVGLLGVRSWLVPEVRSQQLIRNILLPVQRDWMISRGVKQVALTFNEYNRNLIHLFERQIVKRVPRSSRHMFYLNMQTVDYPVMIQNTPQWVIYERLDPNWSFNWRSLRAGEGYAQT